MQTKLKRRTLAFSSVIYTLLMMFVLATPCHAVITLGHQVLHQKGLQLEGMTVPVDSSFNSTQFQACNFSTINFGWWFSTYNYDTWAANGILLNGSNAINFMQWLDNAHISATVCWPVPGGNGNRYGGEKT